MYQFLAGTMSKAITFIRLFLGCIAATSHSHHSVCVTAAVVPSLSSAFAGLLILPLRLLCLGGPFLRLPLAEPVGHEAGRRRGLGVVERRIRRLPVPDVVDLWRDGVPGQGVLRGQQLNSRLLRALPRQPVLDGSRSTFISPANGIGNERGCVMGFTGE